MTHFENLWEEAEQLLKTETDVSSWEELTRELVGKANILSAITDTSFSTQKEELSKLRANMLGKLLLVMTQLSAKEDINVFAALRAAVDDRKISIFENRYK